MRLRDKEYENVFVKIRDTGQDTDNQIHDNKRIYRIKHPERKVIGDTLAYLLPPK